MGAYAGFGAFYAVLGIFCHLTSFGVFRWFLITWLATLLATPILPIAYWQLSNYANKMHKSKVLPGQRQEYYSIQAAAAFLTIGQTTLYKAIEGCQIKHARIGKSIRISHDDLINWVLENTKPTLKEVKAKNASRKKTSGITGAFKHSGAAGGHWPPQTFDDIRFLALQIEQDMEESA
jgi:excisionase family DNA binding protein